MKVTRMIDTSEILGLTEEEARAALKAKGMTLRVTSADGEHFLCTCDYDTDRLNVGLTGGKVSSIGGIG